MSPHRAPHGKRAPLVWELVGVGTGLDKDRTRRRKVKNYWDTREKQYVDRDGASELHAGGLSFPLFVFCGNFGLPSWVVMAALPRQ